MNMINAAFAVDAPALLARIFALEAQRAADLARETREAEQDRVRAIAARQQVDALAFARRHLF